MIIDTERLQLRPFEKADAPDVYEYLKAPSVNCFACMKLDSLESAEKEVIKRSTEKDYYFAVVLKETGKVIGEVSGYPEPSNPEDPYPSCDTFSPCWMLNLDYQGMGYAYEAVYALFDYLFSKKGARRIYAYTEDYNVHCQRLCERLGMRQEGLFREFISFVNDCNGMPIYENTYQYAILKKEWDARNLI